MCNLPAPRQHSENARFICNFSQQRTNSRTRSVTAVAPLRQQFQFVAATMEQQRKELSIMNGHYKLGLFSLGMIMFSATVIVVVLFIALWPYHEIIAWCVLVLGVLAALVALFMAVVHQFNEMALRRRRYRHGEETPLDYQGYPTLLQSGQQVYRQPYGVQPIYGAQPHDSERGRVNNYE